ncbi:hypothetical protein [Yoonia sp. BS5-3]|uniref:Uncharacterized protein n=1 Tax=Yoonia phaeophyticola TaxID=3137369 RepID=A0ABZ2V656_9RHOB
MRILSLVSAAALFAAQPVLAQSIDFGDDSSSWANDGECDDPRFEGSAMASPPLLNDDIRADATDCRKGFEAGQLTLRAEAGAQEINYGDDSSEWANDGECDDRRFIGSTMHSILNNEDVGRDASDCRDGVESGALIAWSMQDSLAATQCSAIDFGDDSGDYANDDECDDARFEGLGMASSVSPDYIGADASDCSRFCDAGIVSLRDY